MHYFRQEHIFGVETWFLFSFSAVHVPFSFSFGFWVWVLGFPSSSSLLFLSWQTGLRGPEGVVHVYSAEHAI
jgi:hypothetical protein